MVVKSFFKQQGLRQAQAPSTQTKAMVPELVEGPNYRLFFTLLQRLENLGSKFIGQFWVVFDEFFH